MGARISQLPLPWDSDVDTMSQSAKDELARKFYAHGPVVLDAVKLGDFEQAITSMKLSPATENSFRRSVAAAVQSRSTDGAVAAQRILSPAVAQAQATQAAITAVNEIRLPIGWLTVWDHKAEDGDVVEIVSTGFTRQIPIMHQPITIAVPVPANGVVNVIGVKDGGGGITVGLSTPLAPVLLPVIAIGQIVGVPVVLR